VCYGGLQCVAMCSSGEKYDESCIRLPTLCVVGEVIHHVLQCVAVCCSVLQCVAVCCSVFQCVAVCSSVMQ